MRRDITPSFEYIIVGSASMEEHSISYKTRKCGPSGIRSDLIGEVTYTYTHTRRMYGCNVRRREG